MTTQHLETPMIDEPQARGAVTALVQQGMEAGGPPLAIERLRRYVAGDANWERLPDDLRRRMPVSAETFFDIELGSYQGYLPDDETLAANAAPVLVLVSEGSLPVYAQAAGRLAQRLGVEVASTPGTHTAYNDHPHELARTVRPFPLRVSQEMV
jgi:pimeloyl-ACP methyl ester carboxylesterase